ncbi:ATP-binding protein [Chitinophaga agrisoli]|nr:ATP-binding protein [Chitinophaga agrisoli]
MTPNEQQTNQDDSTPMRTKATKTPYNYHELLQALEQQGKNIYGRHFAVQDIDRPVILKLLAYFLQDEQVALIEGIDLHKGILLTGRIGCGKTSLINLMRLITQEDYKPIIISCRQICFEFGKDGFDIIRRYSTSSFYPYTSMPRVYCFDDLGLETNVTHWGSTCNVTAEILLSRYDLFISHKMITHVTTNLNSNELEGIYGNRLRSRMRAMFNLIAFPSETTDKRR